MNVNEMKQRIAISDVKPLKIDGVEFTAESIISTMYARIWRSAMVNKNKREADGGGLKATVSQALSAGLLNANDALSILLTNDKAKVNALKEQLPKNEKTEEPSEDDVMLAVKQVLANKGQAS